MAKTKENKTETKFAGFIASKKLDPRRILIASRTIEANQPEDRLIRLKKRLARAAGDAPGDRSQRDAKAALGPARHRRAMQAALAGGKLSGPTKTRLVRAVNRVLEQKKQALVASARALSSLLLVRSSRSIQEVDQVDEHQGEHRPASEEQHGRRLPPEAPEGPIFGAECVHGSATNLEC